MVLGSNESQRDSTTQSEKPACYSVIENRGCFVTCFVTLQYVALLFEISFLLFLFFHYQRPIAPRYGQVFFSTYAGLQVAKMMRKSASWKAGPVGKNASDVTVGLPVGRCNKRVAQFRPNNGFIVPREWPRTRARVNKHNSWGDFVSVQTYINPRKAANSFHGQPSFVF